MATQSEELTARLRELTRTVKHGRRQWALDRPAMPAAALDLLVLVDEVSRRSPACHAKELVDRTGLDPSTVSRAVTVLVESGLVERQPDLTDRRASILAVTPAGRAVLSDAEAWYDAMLGRALADWRPDEISALTGLLERLTGGLQDALDATRSRSRDLEAAR